MKSHATIAVAIATLSGNYACADAFNSASFVSTSASLHQAERKDVAARSMQKQFALNMAEDRDYTSPMRQRQYTQASSYINLCAYLVSL